jgi:hypothetical protein
MEALPAPFAQMLRIDPAPLWLVPGSFYQFVRQMAMGHCESQLEHVINSVSQAVLAQARADAEAAGDEAVVTYLSWFASSRKDDTK